MEPVGYADILGDGETKRFLVLKNGTLLDIADLGAEELEVHEANLPFFAQAQRQNLLPLALSTLCINKLKLLEPLLEENKRLRSFVIQHGLEERQEETENALAVENKELHERVFHVEKHSVAALQAIVIRLHALTQSFAPLGKSLARHPDPNVREAYKCNLSILTISSSLAERAIEICTELS